MFPGARGRGGANTRGGRVGGRRGRGRGQAPVVESSLSVTHASETPTHHTDSVSETSGSASVSAVGAGRGAGLAGGGVGPGVGAAPAQDRLDRMEGILAQLLERFPTVVPDPAPVMPPGFGAQPRAVMTEVRPTYLEMMSQMRQMSTAFFAGGVGPEEADEWRMRMERNFRSVRCPEDYRVEIAIHYLSGDAHLWWRAVEARRPGAQWTWGEFVAEFNAKYFPQEALDRLGTRFVELVQGDRTVREYDAEFSRLLVYADRGMEDERTQVQRFLRGLRADLRIRCRVTEYASRAKLVEMAAGIEEDLRGQLTVAVPAAVPVSVVPAVQPRRQQQQQQQSGSGSGSGKGGKPAQGQKRKWDGASRTSQRSGACYGCGSLEHRLSGCPRKGDQQQSVQRQQQSQQGVARVCFHCGESGHIRPMCPKLQPASVAAIQPVEVQPRGQIAAVQQPLGQIGPAPRVFSPAEFGQSSGAGQITGKILDLTCKNS